MCARTAVVWCSFGLPDVAGKYDILAHFGDVNLTMSVAL